MAIVQILKFVRGILYYGFIYTKTQFRFVGYTNVNWSGAIDG